MGLVYYMDGKEFPLKVGLAVYNFDPKKGGAERYAYDLALRLLQKGHKVYIFCSKGIETEGINLVPLTVVPYPRWLRTLFFALKHRVAIKGLSLDVMLGFGNTFVADVYQSHGGVHKVWMEREIVSYEDRKERRLKAFLLKNNINQKIQEWIGEYPIKKRSFFKIVAISDMVKRHMLDHYPISDGDITVVYNGVDIERFIPPKEIPKGPPVILFSAGNFRLKGLSPLLDAISILSKTKRSFKLHIMGRGNKKRYGRKIKEYRLGDIVYFLGEQKSPENIYRSSHILVHPTFYDACSLTTMEAMASGLPVVTTRWNGSSALIGEDEGFVIDEPQDIEGLASSIITLFDENLRVIMGKKGRKKIENFTMERNAFEIEKVLYEAKDEKGRKGVVSR
ncbi:MAG: glycosyltransferase family 4 protein [Syntrophorhabdaceae bacterium]|nr:glycosyltransferase family 4 protein [Syntrophorhabdaceae bacterium]